MFSRWIIFIPIVLALAPFALAEKPPAMDPSPHAAILGTGLASNTYQTPAALVLRFINMATYFDGWNARSRARSACDGAPVSMALPGHANSLQSGTLTTSDLVSGAAAPFMVAQSKPKPPPPPPPAPKPKPKSKSKTNQDSYKD
jgi:hypothetical protein